MPPVVSNPRNRLPHAVLEDEHEDPVRGRDGEQVEDDRLRRDHDRAEGDEQEQEREAEHEREHVRGDGLHLVVGVLRLGREPADRDLGVRDRADGRRDDLVPQRREGGFEGPSLPSPSIGIAMLATVASSLTSTRIGSCIGPLASARLPERAIAAAASPDVTSSARTTTFAGSRYRGTPLEAGCRS